MNPPTTPRAPSARFRLRTTSVLLAAAFALTGLAAPVTPAQAAAPAEGAHLAAAAALLETAAAIEHQAMYGGGGFHAPQLRQARALAHQAATVYRAALDDAPDDDRALAGLADALDFFHPTPSGAEVRARLAAVTRTAATPTSPEG